MTDLNGARGELLKLDGELMDAINEIKRLEGKVKNKAERVQILEEQLTESEQVKEQAVGSTQQYQG